MKFYEIICSTIINVIRNLQNQKRDQPRISLIWKVMPKNRKNRLAKKGHFPTLKLTHLAFVKVDQRIEIDKKARARANFDTTECFHTEAKAKYTHYG